MGAGVPIHSPEQEGPDALGWWSRSFWFPLALAASPAKQPVPGPKWHCGGSPGVRPAFRLVRAGVRMCSSLVVADSLFCGLREASSYLHRKGAHDN